MVREKSRELKRDGEGMRKVVIYDRTGCLAGKIREMPFWAAENDLLLLDKVCEKEALFQILHDEHPSIVIAVREQNEASFLENIRQVVMMGQRMQIVVIGYEKSYETVRSIFQSGAVDYLIWPIEAEKMKAILLGLGEKDTAEYVESELKLKMDALTDAVLQGGGQRTEIVRSILAQIYTDAEQDTINCQAVADRAKCYVYERLVEREPWLEKFLYRGNFVRAAGSVPMSREKLEQDWAGCFQEVDRVMNKYHCTEDKMAQRIIRFIAAHVDERLTLEGVGEGVFLNQSYVSHAFKKATGINLIDYIGEMKVERAKVLLRDRYIKIYDVASIVGYANTEYFAKVFKKKTGYTPSAYQRILRHEETPQIDKNR